MNHQISNKYIMNGQNYYFSARDINNKFIQCYLKAAQKKQAYLSALEFTKLKI